MGRANGRNRGMGSSADGSRGGPFSPLREDSIVIDFGEDLASTPEFDTEEIATTLIHFDPQSGRLLETNIDLFLDASADGEYDMDEDDRMSLRGELEYQLLKKIREALSRGEDIKGLWARGKVEFDVQSGMSFDRSEPTYRTVEISGELYVQSPEEEGTEEITNPIGKLLGRNDSGSKEALAQIISQKPTSKNSDWAYASLALESQEALQSVRDSSKILDDLEVQDPRISGARDHLDEIRKGISKYSGAGRTREEGRVEMFGSMMEQLQEASGGLRWNAGVISRAAAKMNLSEEDSQKLQEAQKQLERTAEEIDRALEDASDVWEESSRSTSEVPG